MRWRRPDGSIVPPSQFIGLATGIAGARRVILPDVAHLPPLERPDDFNRLVLDFLRQRRSAP